MHKFIIGYLDDDPGQKIEFHNLFKDKFDIKIIEMNEITSPEDIIKIITQMGIELIVLDFMLNSHGNYFNADKIVSEIKKWNPYFPVLILTSHEMDAFQDLDNVNIINRKEDLNKEKSNTNIFVLKIEKNILNYKKIKNDTMEKLKKLSDKKLNTGLSISEEEDYYNLFRYLNDISPSEKMIPSDFITPEKITTLHDLLQSAKDILKELKGY